MLLMFAFDPPKSSFPFRKPKSKKKSAREFPKLTKISFIAHSMGGLPLKKTFQPMTRNIFAQNINRGCEWPEGHPNELEFHFCGKERFEDKPYCLDHCAIAYVIPEKEEGKTKSNRIA